MSRPRVLLADDHAIVAEGLKRLLSEDFELVGVASDGRALVSAAGKLRPDVIVADIGMPYLNGLEALTFLKRDNPDIKVVFLTMHQDTAYARRALGAGASGFVVKHSAAAELVMAIHAALKGRTFITPSIAGKLLQDVQKTRRDGAEGSLVTPRQREILQHLADGLSVKQIAERHGISPRTVEFHKHQVMEANDLHSVAELIHFAIKHGIVTI